MTPALIHIGYGRCAKGKRQGHSHTCKAPSQVYLHNLIKWNRTSEYFFLHFCLEEHYYNSVQKYYSLSKSVSIIMSVCARGIYKYLDHNIHIILQFHTSLNTGTCEETKFFHKHFDGLFERLSIHVLDCSETHKNLNLRKKRCQER